MIEVRIIVDGIFFEQKIKEDVIDDFKKYHGFDTIWDTLFKDYVSDMVVDMADLTKYNNYSVHVVQRDAFGDLIKIHSHSMGISYTNALPIVKQVKIICDIEKHLLLYIKKIVG